MPLQGSRELRARLRAIKQTFKPVGRKWGDDTVRYAKAHVPAATGRTRASIRVRNASQRRATVVGRYTVNFIDAGTAQHTERAKRRKAMRYGSGNAVHFAKRVHHPAQRARPFKRAAAEYGLRKNPLALELIRRWNEAAP